MPQSTKTRCDGKFNLRSAFRMFGMRSNRISSKVSRNWNRPTTWKRPASSIRNSPVQKERSSSPINSHAPAPCSAIFGIRPGLKAANRSTTDNLINAREIIRKKRDRETLTPAEIAGFIDAYVSGDIADYQVSAWLMAIYLNGMTLDETIALTRAMRDSGQSLNLASIRTRKIDKHSTGGVGDKTSMIITPIAAACGVTVPMITGRALGHTGGTLDKLESIP